MGGMGGGGMGGGWPMAMVSPCSPQCHWCGAVLCLCLRHGSGMGDDGSSLVARPCGAFLGVLSGRAGRVACCAGVLRPLYCAHPRGRRAVSGRRKIGAWQGQPLLHS